jgi:putative transposase
MRKRASKDKKRQGVPTVSKEMARLLLPMVAGMAATKRGVMDAVHRIGLGVLEGTFRANAEVLVGEKGRHQSNRQLNHWGTTPAELTFGGRRVQVQRPRVRRRGGKGKGAEVAVPLFEQFCEGDPLPERVIEQLLLGVATRGYAESLGALADGVVTRGTSKSAASRHIVAKTRSRLRDFTARRLDDLSLVALFLDGIEIAEHAVVVALGVTTDGTKVPLGLWQGSTENTTLCVTLLQNLVERGLKFEPKILCIVDGGKGIRSALGKVLGDAAVIQRCQVHKRRNVLDQLPDERRGYVGRVLTEAYKAASADVARKRLKQLASWLESNGEEGAAASLREGLEETLTVLKLGLPPTLRRTFATTNPIENMNGTIRRVGRNVKRWRPKMVLRWTALGIQQAGRRFRRIKGHLDLPILISALAALDEKQKQLDAVHVPA